jgi:photosystem II stability/assembly factor-like uncharacterized protein
MPRVRRLALLVATIATVLTSTVAWSTPVEAQPAAAPTKFTPSSTSWTSATDGWVLGWVPCASGRCATLLHTTDGGASWPEVKAPDIQPSEVHYQTRVFFAERRGHTIGLVTNGDALYVSYDGAHSWQPLELDGAQLVGGIGANAREVFVVAHQEVGSEVSTQAYSSPIDHPHWQQLRGVSALSPGGLGSTTSVVQGTGAAAQIGVSTYGGVVKLWTAPKGHRFDEAYPCDPLSVMYPGIGADGRQLALCSSNPGRGKMDKVLRTRDADGHFTTVVGEPPLDGLTTDFAVTGDTVAVGATEGDAALVHMSFDGGATWETPFVAIETGPVFDLTFQDAQHGVLVAGYEDLGTTVVYRTVDGGHRWTELGL